MRAVVQYFAEFLEEKNIMFYYSPEVDTTRDKIAVMMKSGCPIVMQVDAVLNMMEIIAPQVSVVASPPMDNHKLLFEQLRVLSGGEVKTQNDLSDDDFSVLVRAYQNTMYLPHKKP